MYLAQKEAWEQQAENMQGEQPCTVVTQMGEPKYTPCPTILEHSQIQSWMSTIYLDIAPRVSILKLYLHVIPPVCLFKHVANLSRH